MTAMRHLLDRHAHHVAVAVVVVVVVVASVNSVLASLDQVGGEIDILHETRTVGWGTARINRWAHTI